jgi:hypothetical protein
MSITNGLEQIQKESQNQAEKEGMKATGRNTASVAAQC